MEQVVVERSFAKGQSYAELEAQEQAVARGLQSRNVRPAVSYLCRTGTKMISVYQSPDAELVRQVQEESGIPYDHIWSSQLLGEAPLVNPAPRSLVIIQRELPEGTLLEHIIEMKASFGGCLHLYNATHEGSYVSRDLRRAVCFHLAPDVDTMSTILEKYPYPWSTVFSASIHMPS